MHISRHPSHCTESESLRLGYGNVSQSVLISVISSPFSLPFSFLTSPTMLVILSPKPFAKNHIP